MQKEKIFNETITRLLKEIPDDPKENMIWRAGFYEKLSKDPALAASAKVMFQMNPIFAFKAFFWTYDPRPNVATPKLPFCPYEFQVKLIFDLMYAIDTGHDLLIFKTRDMGVSWIVTTLFLWYWLKNIPGYDFLVGSRKQEYVDKKGNISTLIEKMRYNLYNIPSFLLPEGFEKTKHDTFMSLRNPESGCIIIGEANNADFGTAARVRAALLDEFSKWQGTDYEAWTSLGDTTPCRIVVSTPKGRSNKFADLVTGKDGTEIKIIKLPWQLHPKKDQKWYEEECKRRTPMEVAQELDLSLEGSAGQRFFDSFNRNIHLVKQPEIVPGRDVLVGFDFGYIHPALVSGQIDDNDRLIIQHSILGKNVELSTFAEYCWKRLNTWYKNCDFTFCVDIAGTQHNDKSPTTSIEILRSIVDAKILYRRIIREDINEQLRKMLNTLIAGQPSFMLLDWAPPEDYQLPNFIDREDTGYLIEGFAGGIHYPQKNASGKEDWEKEGYFEHGFDAIGFILANLFMRGTSPGQREDFRKKIDDRNQMILQGGPNVQRAYKQRRLTVAQRLRANTRRFRLHSYVSRSRPGSPGRI